VQIYGIGEEIEMNVQISNKDVLGKTRTGAKKMRGLKYV